MEKLKLGQILWRIDKYVNVRYYVEVIGIYDDCFVVEYSDGGNRIKRTFHYSILGKKLFTNSQLSILRKKKHTKDNLKKSNVFIEPKRLTARELGEQTQMEKYLESQKYCSSQKDEADSSFPNPFDLTIGQGLWRIDEERHLRYCVEVVGLYEDGFIVEHKGNKRKFSYNIIGKKMFTAEQMRMKGLL